METGRAGDQYHWDGSSSLQGGQRKRGSMADWLQQGVHLDKPGLVLNCETCDLEQGKACHLFSSAIIHGQ